MREETLSGDGGWRSEFGGARDGLGDVGLRSPRLRWTGTVEGHGRSLTTRKPITKGTMLRSVGVDVLSTAIALPNSFCFARCFCHVKLTPPAAIPCVFGHTDTLIDFNVFVNTAEHHREDRVPVTSSSALLPHPPSALKLHPATFVHPFGEAKTSSPHAAALADEVVQHQPRPNLRLTFPMPTSVPADDDERSDFLGRRMEWGDVEWMRVKRPSRR